MKKSNYNDNLQSKLIKTQIILSDTQITKNNDLKEIAKDASGIVAELFPKEYELAILHCASIHFDQNTGKILRNSLDDLFRKITAEHQQSATNNNSGPSLSLKIEAVD